MCRLKIDHLSKTYRNGARALSNVNLSISNGIFGLLGPNGAGKSSLMRTIATLQQPGSGEIFFDGQNIHQHPHWLRSQLGYLPQDFGVYPKVSAEDLLDHFAVLKGLGNRAQRKEQVLALLQQTNLFPYRKQAVSTFSGGMRQRFGVAQALLGNPQLVIVDEPTAGLDPQERNRFHDLLSEIGEQVVVILSTHIVEDVHDLCPEMAVMAQGQIILQGKPSLLRHSLEGQIWRKNVSKEDLKNLETTFPVISMRRTAGQMQVHILSQMRPDNGFEPCDPGLEDVYFSALLAHQAGKEDQLW